MDCRDAQFYLRIRREAVDELGREVTVELERHCADCPVCAAEARSAARFDAAVAVAMRNVPLPPGLRDQLVARLSAQRGAVLRRKAYQFAAAAAAVLLSVGLGYGYFWQARPQADTTALVMDLDTRSDPERAEETVRRWLLAEQLPDRLPEPFDFRFYRWHGKEPILGRDVPVVVFSDLSGAEIAKVYAFRDTVFDLKMLQDAQSSHWQAKVYPQGRGVTYVVVFTTPELTPFLRSTRSG